MTPEIRPALEQALSSGKPSIVEGAVGPYEPPMPLKISVERALHFAETFATGQPGAGGRVALTIFRGRLDELLK